VISVVVPVHNERESLPILHDELVAVSGRTGLRFEVVFVDDGSTDDSWAVICDLARQDSTVRGIRFRRNFGKAAALSAGFRAAHGAIIMTLDGDLQDDPAEIPRFLAALDEGTDGKGAAPSTDLPAMPTGRLDVVSGWKRVRHDPWHKVGPSRIFNLMVSYLTGVHLHDHNCGMKCYRSEVVREVRLYGELHRFIPVLAEARGFRIGEVEINHRARRYGRSKYGVRRFIKGFLDLLTVKFLTGFGRRPQHLLGTLGLLCFLVSILILLWLTGDWIGANIFHAWDATPLHQRPLLTYAVAGMLLGVQFMSVGILAELITAFQGREEDDYSIAGFTPAHESSNAVTHDANS
jgi:glycosyltransferase involved in cell wall biosynthesis